MYYFLAPLIGWFVAGSMKYAINYIRFGSDAKAHIGNGGFPSNHTTIMTTVTMLIGFREGFDSSVFGLGAAILAIVVIDAIGLRRYVGLHAKSLNALITDASRHREKMGHTKLEVLGGLILGTMLGYILNLL